MQYREIPKTGDKLSALGFGCMRLPQKSGIPGDGRIDKERAEQLICSAIDRGVNYFDTGMIYHRGGGEPFLGELFQNGLRDRVRLATKLPPWSAKTKEDLDLLLTAQMDRLRTDHIDYYLLHALEANNWKKLLSFDVLSFLDRAKREGRIGNAGFSFHGDLDTFKEIVDAYDWELCQIQYNFLDTDYQAGTRGLKYAADRKLGVIIMEPLRGGTLAGQPPEAIDAIWQSADTRRTPADWALRWVWNHPEVTVVLSGMNETRHLEENIRVAQEALPDALPPEDLERFAAVEQTYRRLMKAGCTGCRYCMPCPAGVNIPECFESYNRYYMFGDKAGARMFYLARMYGALNATPALASMCKNCGQCEAKCPQQLPIQSLLADVVQTFESRSQKAMAWFLGQFFKFQRFTSARRAKRSAARTA